VITWYLTRAAGAAALVLLTGSVMLGIADVRRWSTRAVPRFVVDGLHRTVSLLAVAMLGVHIVTTVVDGFAPITLSDAVIPFGSAYRPLWLGLGALSFDLLLAVTITSILRARVGARAWRITHWAAYACWPLALVHGLGTGSDVQAGWMLWLSLACTAGVIVAVLVRVAGAAQRGPGVLAGVTAAVLALVLGLAVWLPGGPLASGWAKQSGTPTSLLTK
jgi:methionine sulfoxide reductase heme-binding subunit